MLAQSFSTAGSAFPGQRRSVSSLRAGRGCPAVRWADRRMGLLGVVFLGAWLCCLGVAAGETNEAPTPTDTPTAEAVQQRLKQLDTATNLDDATKTQIRELLQQTLKDIESAAGWVASAAGHDEKTDAAPKELTKTKTALDQLREPQVVIPQVPLAELEQTLSEKATTLKTAQAQLAKCEEDIKRRADRRVKVPKLVLDIGEQIAKLDKTLLATTAAENPSELDVARHWSALARRQSLQNEKIAYEKELSAYERRTELLPLLRDLAARRVAIGDRELAVWRDAVNRQRAREAEAQLSRARAAARAADAQAHPAIAALRKRNEKLAELHKDYVQKITQAGAEQAEVAGLLKTLGERYKQTKKKVVALGRTNTIGALLRSERDKMLDLRAHRKNIKDRESAMGQCQYNLVELEDRRAALLNIEAEIGKCLGADRGKTFGGDRADLEDAARKALETEREYVGTLTGDLNDYYDRLLDLNFDEEQLTRQIAEYTKYIDQRVLWIQSTAPLDRSSLAHLAPAARWLASPQRWLRLGNTLVDDARGQPLPWIVAFLIFGALAWNQRRLRKKTSEIGATAARATCCSILPTVEAVCLIALAAAVVPAVLWYVAWRLRLDGNPSKLAEAVSAGLVYTGGIYLLLELIRQMCRPEGLSESHFDWSGSALRPVRNYVRTAKVVTLPFVFLAVTAAQANERLNDPLDRLAFVVVMVVCATLVGRMLRYPGGVYQAMLATHRDGPLVRLRLLWYPLVVAVPLTLAALAAAGYYYTAQQLAGRMVATLFILFGLVLVRSLLLRWILVNRRKLAIEQARARRAAAAAEAKSADETAGTPEIPTPSVPTLDLATINVQTRYLVKYSLALAGFLGIWLIWVDVLPALGALDDIRVWGPLDPSGWTSLADLFLAVLAFATTAVAAQNAPGLLELTLLQSPRFDAGFRYTVATVFRYAITVVGVLVGCHMLGLRWGAVQWLVAAVSVGLGFGLQEIFANFVSGIIILFEQPIRVGDIVTVDDTTGVVSRIRMRATTITNWDRKEFIVPNKEFITGRLLNWTLSDQINRVVINVGIAYGSDTQLATTLLTKIVREHPLVLDEPPPRVTFEQFGDSALNYVVRCFLPDMENRLAVIHDLHTSVDQAFREAGIEIAFPQQDIHIRSIHADLEAFHAPGSDARKHPELVREDDDLQAENRHVA